MPLTVTPPPPALPSTHPATSPAHRDTVQPTESHYLVEGGEGGGHQKQAHASESLNIYSGPQVPAVKVKQPSGLPPGGGGRAETDQKTIDLCFSLSILPHPSRLHGSLTPSLCKRQKVESSGRTFAINIFSLDAFSRTCI